MAVLSDRDILKAVEAKRLRIGGFRPENLTPNGYDLTIAEVAVLGAKPETVRSGIAKVPPQTRFAVATVEVVDLGADVTAQLWLRTTWARRGVITGFGKVDAGFRGTLTLGGYNANASEVVELPIGERFAQIVFEDLTSPAEKAYGERSGHWQDQKGVRLK
ncbi:MAG: dCTP deaminase [Euryarchaeota archaeon RBG_16_68_12]|nr:MAG: dCTP deaminase [Euryarchaeota archaeon RBG_16_68_12]